jgi:Cytochrome c3
MANSIKKALSLLFLVISVVICFGGPRLQPVQGQVEGNDPLSKWRPAKDYSGLRYVGSRLCAECHANKSSQLATPMAHAIEAPADSQILKTHPQLTFRNGPYTYKITRQGSRSLYTVTDGVATISEPILYCFGQGVGGQTFLFQRNGSFYEGRVSYYQEIQGLDITTLHPRTVPTSLEDALGRPMNAEAARGCFACHSTGAVRGDKLELDRLIPGVTCEACHGPGERHIAAVKAKNFKDLQIFNPGKLDGFDLGQEFCGACHQSFDTVMQMPDRGGINNLRFQPYRILSSRSHFTNDRRMSCVACHNPHEKTRHEAAYYDSKCLACHVSSPSEAKTLTHPAPACPVSRQQCVTCHMPKVEVRDLHFKFTDHWIRIVKPNDPVPN